jgi:alcohol dehydrogenase class IV
MSLSLKNTYHRTYNKIMKYASIVIPIPTPKVLTGLGSVKELVKEKKLKKLKKILIVTDKVLLNLNLLDDLFTSLKENNIDYVVYDAVLTNPTIKNVEDGRKLYKDNKCDGIIAFGGGSPIDCAKIIGARISNPYLSVRQMKGLFRVFLPIPPFFCIPTTAGTGSETTIAAVITDTDTHEKFAINDIKIVPKIAVLDPNLMLGLPKHITSTTGLDALTHAIEAYIGLNGTKFTDKKAKNAVKLIFENLENAYNDGSNIEARNNMALASFDAGLAFTRAYIGYVHAIAHNMGGMYGVPHGLANAIILPYVLEYYGESVVNKLSDLAILVKLGENSENKEILSKKFIEEIKNMNIRMNIPSKIKELKKEDIPLITKRALKEANPAYPVPQIMTYKDCQNLILKLLP